MSTTLSIRLDTKLKKQSQVTLKKLGLDISSATKLFLTQVVEHKAIPFPIRTINGFTPEFEAEILAESAHMRKNPNLYKKYTNVKELVKDLHS